MNRNFLPSSNGKISDKQFLQLRIDKLEPSDNSFAFFFLSCVLDRYRKKLESLLSILENHSREVSRPFPDKNERGVENGIRFDRLLNFRNARNIPTAKGLKRGPPPPG